MEVREEDGMDLSVGGNDGERMDDVELGSEKEKSEVEGGKSSNSLSTVSSSAMLVKDDSAPLEAAKSPWGSLWIANVISFLCAVQFSIYFSSLWPYLEEIDKTATQGFFGWVIAGYSIGQMIASPIFGTWSNRIQNTRIPVAVGLVILIGANLLYVFVEAFPYGRKWVLLGARILVGVGAGNLSVLRAYVATASTLKDRSNAIILSTAAFTLGFMIGPGIQAAFTSIGYPGYVSGAFHFDMYTAPGHFSNIANVLAIIVLMTSLKESYAGIVPQATKADPFFALPTFDRTAVVVLIGSWFAILFTGVNIETISSPYSMVMWDWSSSEAVKYNGIILFVSAGISFLVYVGYILVISRWVSERVSIVVGTLMIAAFWLITYPWPFFEGYLDFQLQPIGTAATSLMSNGTTVSSLLTSTLSSALNGTTGSVKPTNLVTETVAVSGATLAPPVGCRPEYHWCESTKRVPLGLYLGAFPLLSIAFPMGNIAIATLYSKVLGPRRQGFMQGVLTAAGSFSRAIGPVLMSYLFQLFGPKASWLLCAVIMFVSIFPYIFLYQRLVPLNPKPSLSTGERFRYKRGYVYRF